MFPIVVLSDKRYLLGNDMPQDPLFHDQESSEWDLLIGELH